MTSTWMRSAPAASTSATCSPRCPKSADRMDGARAIDVIVCPPEVECHIGRGQGIPPRWRREGARGCRRGARGSIKRRLHRRRPLMALVDNLFKGWGGVLLGFGAGIAAPSLFPDAGAAVRPL